jgi:hypothetical protein
MKGPLKKLGLGALSVFVLIQLVPFGRDHENPPVRQEPAWASPETRALAKRACFDCHSNETVWPWYAWVAPASWLVTNDVRGGRHHLNFSEWDRPQKDADEAVEAVREGFMPLPIYLPLHPEADLSDAEKKQLADGLARTPGLEPKANDEH